MALVTAIVGLMVGVTYNAVTVTNLTRTISQVSEDAGQNFRDIQKSIDSLAHILTHRMP